MNTWTAWFAWLIACAEVVAILYAGYKLFLWLFCREKKVPPAPAPMPTSDSKSEEETPEEKEIRERLYAVTRAAGGIAAFTSPEDIQRLRKDLKDDLVRQKQPENAVTISHDDANNNGLIPYEERIQHVYLAGATRTGKSNCLVNMARQDIANGKGVCLIDPSGDSATELLKHIPQERIDDVAYIYPAKYPLPINLLAVSSPAEADILADDLITLFKRISDGWGERMDAILRYAIHTLIAIPGSTFLDIRTLLVDAAYRQEIVAQLDNPTLVHFWTKEYPALPKGSEQPIVSRMAKFTLSAPLRAMLGNPKTAIDINRIMDEGRILIVNLAAIGQDNATIIGSILVSWIQLSLFRRALVPPEKRTMFYLYVDECQNFATEAFPKLLNEAGKYKVSVTLASQFPSQFPQATHNAVLSNTGTRIIFRLNGPDAQMLAGQVGERFSVGDIANLPKYTCIFNPPRHRFLTGKVKCDALPKPTHDPTDEILSRIPVAHFTKQATTVKSEEEVKVAAADEDDTGPAIMFPPEQ